jgi:hypothetical protein
MADTFEVLSTAPKTRVEPGGQYTNVVTVVFRTKPSGQVGVIDIPEVAFTPGEVAKVVGPAAANLEAVKNL